MNIHLLTHERELQRPTNTGSVALEACPGLVSRAVWQRRHPDGEVLALVESGKAALVYPVAEGEPGPADIREFDHLILLDATWQEARKMYNRSPYLQAAPKVVLRPAVPSEYGLRRNQRRGGLCTAECVVEILRLRGRGAAAGRLLQAFREFNRKL